MRASAVLGYRKALHFILVVCCWWFIVFFVFRFRYRLNWCHRTWNPSRSYLENLHRSLRTAVALLPIPHRYAFFGYSIFLDRFSYYLVYRLTDFSVAYRAVVFMLRFFVCMFCPVSLCSPRRYVLFRSRVSSLVLCLASVIASVPLCDTSSGGLACETITSSYHWSPNILCGSLDVIGCYSTSALATRFTFCLYVIGSLGYATLLLATRLSYVLEPIASM